MATSTGPLLGLPLRKMSFRQQVLDLDAGDTVVMYTDGVTEAHHRGEELFGEERLMETVRAAPADVDGVADAILAAVTSYGPSDPRDDVAVIVLRIDGAALDGRIGPRERVGGRLRAHRAGGRAGVVRRR